VYLLVDNHRGNDQDNGNSKLEYDQSFPDKAHFLFSVYPFKTYKGLKEDKYKDGYCLQ
jgi:hypothetical protein